MLGGLFFKRHGFASRTRVLVGIVTVAALSACSNSTSNPSGVGGAGGEGGTNNEASELDPIGNALDATLPGFTLAAPKDFYRFDLRLNGDAVELAQVERVTLPFLPTPSLSPEFLVVGLAGDDVVSAVPVTFPTVVRTSSSELGVRTHTETTVADPRTTVYLEISDDLDRVQVLAPGGEVVLETNDLPSEPVEQTGGPADRQTKRQKLSRDQLAFRYAHIRFLAPGDEATLQPELLTDSTNPATAQIVAPNESLDQVVADGLAHVPPGMLSSVSTIAVVKWPAGHPYAAKVLGMALGPQLVLNADHFADQGEMILTVVHEIAHNYTFLCSAAGNGSALSDWPSAAGEAAAKLVQRFQLAAGLDVAFQGLHESGIPSAVSMAYTVDDTTWQSLSLAQAQNGGFASPYGSVNAWEDIAEYVGSVQAPTATTPGICPLLARVSELTEDVSIPFAKLVFLRAVGALDASKFEACAGHVKGATTEGIHFPQVDFTSGLKAGTLTLEGGSPGFAVYGKGPNTYQILFEYPLRQQGATPLGIHRFDGVTLFNFVNNGARVLLAHDDSYKARAGERGMMLVTEANSDRVSGFIFGLVLQNAVGENTDYMPLGTFLVQ